MAAATIRFKAATPQIAVNLRAAAEQLSNASHAIREHFAAMNQMKDGDGSQASHFDTAAAIYGTVQEDGVTADTGAELKRLYDEMNSYIGNDATGAEQLAAKLKQ